MQKDVAIYKCKDTKMTYRDGYIYDKENDEYVTEEYYEKLRVLRSKHKAYYRKSKEQEQTLLATALDNPVKARKIMEKRYGSHADILKKESK